MQTIHHKNDFLRFSLSLNFLSQIQRKFVMGYLGVSLGQGLFH